jgi:phage terminase large subunit-like protein
MLGKLLSTRLGSRGLALRWKVAHIYVESKVAGQQGWFHLLKDRCKNMGAEASFSIRELKTDRSANAKETRIVGMEPVYENGLFWVNRTGCEQFIQEYETYPNGRFMDLLDVCGYAPQTWLPGSRAHTRDFVRDEITRRSAMLQGIGNAGY